MIATASDVSKNRASTSKNKIKAPAMMTSAAV